MTASRASAPPARPGGARAGSPSAPAAACGRLARLRRLACGLVGAALAGCGAGDLPPNVLLVSLDTLRADRLGCYGHERDTTPFLDSLAAGGLVLERAHAAAPRTAPSHMSLFTGLDPEAHGIWNVKSVSTFRFSLSPDVPTLPERLAAAGWETATFTDTGNIHPVLGFGRGFEFQSNFLAVFEKKLPVFEGFLRGRSPERPLFCFLHTYEPHAPYVPPRRYRGRYTNPGYDGPFLERYEALAEKAAADSFPGSGDFLAAFDGMGERDLRFLSDLYDENVAHVDDVFARFHELWDGLVGADETLLVVLSDHGEAFGEHGLLGHQGELTEELLHVPMIFRGPGVVAGRSAHQVTLTDVAPTLLDVLGVPYDPLEMQGRSFAGLLAGAALEPEPVFHQLYLESRGLRVDAVSDGRTRMRLRRIVGDADSEQPGLVGSALIDLERDPAQVRDQSASRPNARERLDGLLAGRRAENRQRLAARPPAQQGELDEAGRAELQALGYTGD